MFRGWTVLYPKKQEVSSELKDSQEPQSLPEFQQGEHGPHIPSISEGKTSPPAHFNENALLGAMETAGKFVDDESLKEALKEKGIGTPATRASIIETLLKREYIERKGKLLITTNLGRYLIALIQDQNLKSPELTGEWEAKLKEIEQGKYSAIEFMQQIKHYIAQIISESDMYRLNNDIYGCCPKCKSPVIKGKIDYGCSKWREGCSFILRKVYKGMTLNEGQIRLLLQKRMIPQQVIAGAILSLSDSGEVTEIPLPENQNNRFKTKKNYPRKFNTPNGKFAKKKT